MASGNDNGEILLHEVSTGRLLCRRSVVGGVDGSAAAEEESGSGKKKTKQTKKDKAKAEEDHVVRCIRWNPNPTRSMVVS